MTSNDCVPELTNGEFESFVKDGTVMIDFFADWCMPCMTMVPIVDELCEKFKGKIKIGKVNVGEEEGIGIKFNVSSIPNFTIFKEGKVVEQFTGSMALEDFEEKLEAYV